MQRSWAEAQKYGLAGSDFWSTNIKQKNEGTVLLQTACPYLFHQAWDLARKASLGLVCTGDKILLTSVGVINYWNIKFWEEMNSWAN